ncbi:hypothetical protein GGR51DRAFT_503413 [Nemania sp. FL0031]|nr:hypothetical protein GGR51DRAFT_503413 [Nemania sp. FL0031]
MLMHFRPYILLPPFVACQPACLLASCRLPNPKTPNFHCTEQANKMHHIKQHYARDGETEIRPGSSRISNYVRANRHVRFRPV